MNNACFFFVLILLSQPGQSTSAAPTYLAAISVRSATHTPVSSLTMSTDPAMTFNLVYSSAIANDVTLTGVLALSSFSCLSSNQFSFNTTVTAITLTSLTYQLVVLGNSYFNLIKISYMVRTYAVDASHYSVKALWNDCFLCTNLITGQGDRSQTYTNQTLPMTVPDGTHYLLQSFISGLKFYNNMDMSKTVTVSAQIVNGTNYISQTVSVTGNTVLEWICLTTGVIEPYFNDYVYQVTPYQIGQFSLNQTSQTIDITTYPSYMTLFGFEDAKLYGLSSIILYLGKPNQIIDFYSENITNVESGYTAMKAGGMMGYYFISSRTCPVAPATEVLYSIVTQTCYSACPGGQFVIGNICQACHYSCQTCTGPNNNQCSTCDVGLHRSLSSLHCYCSSGYLDNSVALCAPCSYWIPNCLQCSNINLCTSCSSPFVFNSTSVQCQCPSGTYLIPANTLCATFPGCTLATINTNVITCSTCDTSNGFYLDTSTPIPTCKCIKYTVLSGKICVDICGDGYNPLMNSTTYCDDGNVNSGDGCSLSCAIQTNFGCFNPPNTTKSYCSPVKSYTLKYLYAKRVISQNSGIFIFSVSPTDSALAVNGFTYYVETTIPNTYGVGTYDPSTSLLQIKVAYLKTIEGNQQTLKITLDPYKMWVHQQSFTLTLTGVNYNLTYDSTSTYNTFIFYAIISVCALILVAAIAFTLIDYKIASVQLLLSAQFVYFGLITFGQSNVALYSLTGLRYLVGFNTIKQFEINLYNYDVPFMLTSYTFAEFLLNFNYMAAVMVLAILIIIPLKINAWYRMYKRNQYASPEAQQKLMYQENSTSLKQLSADIKKAQLIVDTYLDRVYFIFSLIPMLPIIVYFSIQLGFIGKVGQYQLSSFANIILSILLLMVDFCFFILIFQDTDKKMKMFQFGSKKLKTYPYRLIMFYFVSTCIITIFLLSSFTFYILIGLDVLLIIYVCVQNPYDKPSLQYVDSISKPIITLVCLGLIQATGFFSQQMIFLPVGIFALLLISVIVTTVRVIRVKRNRIQTTKRILQESGQNEQENDMEFDKNLKETDNSELDSKKLDKKNVKNKKQQSLDANEEQPDQLNQPNQSGQGLNKPFNKYQETDQLPQDDEDQLAKIKRSLRQDLKKRRGIINKVNQEDGNSKIKSTKKSKKNNHANNSQTNDDPYKYL